MKKTIFLIETAIIAFGLVYGLANCSSSTLETKNSEEPLRMCGEKEYVSPNNVEIKDAVNQSSSLSAEWYKKSRFYQIWIKSFYDSDNDGCGDLDGIKKKLDYIKDIVGCDTVWLSPFSDCSYKSKSKSDNMHGYDVIDYYGINACFGSKEDLIDLIKACHSKGMKIICDFVPNHTSIRHRWFTDSEMNLNNKRDWYVWDEKGNSFNPCGQEVGNGNGGAWYYSEKAELYYYGAFGRDMPDLNFKNYEVREEIKNIARYYLNMGFDGLRVDACRYFIESSTSPKDTSYTHSFIQELREMVDKYPSPKLLLGETWVDNDREVLDKYFGSEDKKEFNMIMDFDAGRKLLETCQFDKNNDPSSLDVRDRTGNTLRSNPTVVSGASYGTFLCNHDAYEDRIGTEFNGDSRGIKLCTTMSLMRPNVPIIYYGQEIGMEGNSGGLKENGDISQRRDFDWSKASEQVMDLNSTLMLNNALNSIRKKYSSLFSNGQIRKLQSSARLLAYTIKDESTSLLCVYNLTGQAQEVETISGLNAGFTQRVSVLIGDNQEIKNSYANILSDKAIIYKLAPYAYRVYLLGSDTEENLFDDEIYELGEESSINYKRQYEAMYLKGDMNSWRGTSLTSLDKTLWQGELSLQKGTYEFKMCTTQGNTWDKTWGSESSDIINYTNTVINTSGGDNIKLKVSQSGTYTIVFDANSEVLMIKGENISDETCSNNTIFLRGTFSSWEDYKGLSLHKDGDYYFIRLRPQSGTHEFKFSKANNSWSKQWGSQSGSKMNLTVGTFNLGTLTTNGNLKIDCDGNTYYTFKLDTINKKLIIYTDQ